MIGIAAAVIAAAGLYYVGSGFIPRTDMTLGDFSVSKDEEAYLTFFSTFGGLNSSFCAKKRFTITLPEACTRIYFE